MTGDAALAGMLHCRLSIRRIGGGLPARWQEFAVEVPPEAYVLDALEAAAQLDPDLMFRRACHHASCGSCAVLINGRERLPCITKAAEAVVRGVIRLEPLANFPVVADLVVDRTDFLARMRRSGMAYLRRAEGDAVPGTEPPERFENCIECGICVSACPVAAGDPNYLGPAALAAAERTVAEPRGAAAGSVSDWVDTRHGVWRCHGIFECSEACPMQVEPGTGIMRLRSRLGVGK